MIDNIILGGGTYDGYMCPITNQWITSRKERKEVMKRHDVHEIGDDKIGKPRKARPDIPDLK